MTDTITESFCERCGTRYSFEPTAKPRRGGIGRVRVLTRGLTTFVSNDGMPLAEAMASARADEGRAGTARQLDAFHKAFNFCMSCRQYTCANCWNEKAGECLSCAPDLSREVLPPAFPDLPATGPVEGNGELGHEAIEATAWPRVDLDRAAPVDAAAAALAFAAEAPATEPATEPELVLESPEVLARLDAFVSAPPPSEELTEDELAEIQSALASVQAPLPPEIAVAAGIAAPAEPAATAKIVGAAPDEDAPEAVVAAADVEAAAEPSAPATPDERAGAARGQTRGLLGRFRPAKAAAAAAVAADHPAEGTLEPDRGEEAAREAGGVPAAIAPEAGAAPADIVLAETEAAEPAERAAADVGEVPGDAVATDIELAGAAVAAEIALADAASAESEDVVDVAEPVAAARPQADIVEQPTWQVVAPEAAPTPASPPVSWPETPAWPDGTQVPMPSSSQVPGPDASPWASRLAISRPEPTGVWAASSQEVLGTPATPGHAGAAPGIQACVSCGLSLSANARFCRRCGARQA